MSLWKKIEEHTSNFVLRKMGEDYRHAYELLSIKNLEGLEEIRKAPKEKMMNTFNKYPKTQKILLGLSMGIDLRIERICEELGYNQLETQLFFHISKKISYCELIRTPYGTKIEQKIMDTIKSYFKKISPDFVGSYDLIFKFYSDKKYYLKMMDKFYKEIIPEFEKSMKK